MVLHNGMTGIVTEDDRGIPLKEGDIVLYSNRHISYPSLGRVKKSGDNLLCSHYDSSTNVPYVHLLKITEEYLEYGPQYRMFCKSLSNRLEYSGKDNYIHFGAINNVKEELWKEENKKSNTLGMHMWEYFGRNLKAGDFGLYANTDSNAYEYGIVLSHTHIFTESGYKKRIKHFILLNNLTEEEITIKNKIASSYKLNLQKAAVASNKAYQIGDVYFSNNKAYVYLGRVKLDCYLKCPSDVLCEYKLDGSKEIWLKVTFGGHKTFNLYDILQESTVYDYNYILSSLFRETKVEEEREAVFSNALLLHYKEVNKFDCLATRGVKGATYKGHVNLAKKYQFEVALAKYAITTHIVVLELLDL